MVFPTIMPANSVSGYEISNSLRFNKADTAVLRKTFSGSPTATQKCTFSFWTKLADPSVTTQKEIFSAIKSGSNEDRFGFHAINNGIHGGFELAFNNGNDGAMYIGTGGNTLVRFRDSSAWYHFVIAIDSTQGTASNRVKVYVNGVLNEVDARIDGGAITTDVVLTEDYALAFLTAGAHSIGENVESAGTTPYDGYLADFNFIDGTQLDASYFGETDDNGVWIPKRYGGAYGNYGFFMEFKQTGTGTNASGMGADTSGNTNHFAPVNLAAIDVTTDTPTNNFATINPLANYFNPAALTEGNTRVDFDNGTSTVYNISTIGVASGKWYCEVKAVDVPSYGEIGIASRPCIAAGNNDKLTVNQYNYGYTAQNGNVKSNNQAGSSYGDSFTDDDMIGIALDLDNNKLYFSKNGTFQNSGDPTTGATGTGAVSIQAPSGTIDGVYYFAGGDNKNGDTTRMDFNFGNPAFALDSGNADANGHGDFEYAVPSGYFALCTKNLAEYG